MRNLLLVLSLVAAVTAACSGTPTTAASSDDLQPTFDGGVFGGSGNNTGMAPSPLETAQATGTEVTAADSTNARGGVFGGSGN